MSEPRRRWRIAWGVAALTLLLLLALVLGPRRGVERFPVGSPQLPQDLDRFLSAREAKHSDLRPGCAAQITWVDSRTRARTPLSVVYLHGFSATRQETAPLSARLARELAANLFEARLRGHGRGEAAMADGTVEAWLEDGAEALAIGRRLGERVLLVGCSTGAALATWLVANGHAADVAGLVLLSPNFGTRHRGASLLTGPWGTQLAWASTGGTRSFTPLNERQAAYWTTRYPSRVLVDMQALVDLANRSDLSQIRTPALVVYSAQDRVVDPARTVARFADLGSDSKRLLAFEQAEDPAHHVLAGDVLSPGATTPLLTEILSFVRRRM